VRWLETRINLTEVFSFVTTFGLAYGDIDTRKPVDQAIEDAFRRPMPRYAQWPHVLGLLAFVLFLFQAGTGLLLAFYYQPAAEGAYSSVLTILRDVSLGWYVHQMHRWGSAVLVALLLLRMVRFYLQGVYRQPHELLWVFGAVLLLLALQADFTGRLLSWGQHSYWSVTRGLEIVAALPVVGPVLGYVAGGLQVSGLTLTRFYVLHVVCLPALLVIFFYLHFATVRRVGLSASPGATAGPPRPLYPDHLLNLVILLLLLFGVILTLAVVWPAVFQGPADPFSSPAGIRPPWYLLPAYGLLELLPATLAGGLLLAALTVFLAVPFVDRSATWSRRRPLALWALLLALAALVSLGVLGYSLRG
jgi:quinol-cytochrome oxidoreductase complex cytochrome b subunit